MSNKAFERADPADLYAQTLNRVIYEQHKQASQGFEQGVQNALRQTYREFCGVQRSGTYARMKNGVETGVSEITEAVFEAGAEDIKDGLCPPARSCC